MRIDPDTYHPLTEAWSRRRATSPPHDPKGAVGASYADGGDETGPVIMQYFSRNSSGLSLH